MSAKLTDTEINKIALEAARNVTTPCNGTADIHNQRTIAQAIRDALKLAEQKGAKK